MLTEVGHGLTARMIELHPELRASGPTNSGPLAKAFQVPLIFEHHTTGAGHGAAVDHHVAGQQQAGFAFGPRLIQPEQGLRRCLPAVGKVLFHRGFGDAVADGLAVGQIQRLEGRHT